MIPKTLSSLSFYNLEINEPNLANFVDIKDIYYKSFNYNYAASSDITPYVILEEHAGVY